MKIGFASLKILLAAAVIVALNASLAPALAQQSAPPPPSSASPDKRIGKAEVFYVAGENATMVNVPNLNVWGSNLNKLVLSAAFKVAGKKVVKPGDVYFSFVSVSKKKKFSGNEKLEVRAGNKNLQFGQMRHTSPPSPGNVVIEQMEFKVPYSSFLELTGSDDVAMRLGEIEFSMPRGQIEALRDLSRAVGN